MTMANSLELRVPFLDPEVFAVASRLPLDAEDHQVHHEVRVAPGAGADRSRARAQPAEAGLSGADPALAAGRRADGLGLRHGGFVRSGRSDRHDGGPDDARRTPQRRKRSQQTAVDRADLHAVARDLRRGQRDPTDQRADVPGAALGHHRLSRESAPAPPPISAPASAP